MSLRLNSGTQTTVFIVSLPGERTFITVNVVKLKLFAECHTEMDMRLIISVGNQNKYQWIKEVVNVLS